MRLRRLAAIPAALALAVLAGCGDEPSTVRSGQSPDDLRGRTFISTEVTERDRSRELVDDSVVRLEFTADGRLIANAGCNTGQGDVRLDDGKLVVEGYGTTEMGCPGGLNEQDAWLADFIAARPSWRLSGDELTLSAEETRITMRDRAVVQPDLPLEGTTWTLESFVDGSGPDASVRHSAAMEQAWLRLADGRAEAHGGCNGMGGDAEIAETDAGYTVTFGPLIGTKMACRPEIMTVENQLASVLTGKVTATIDANMLTLSTPKGIGATFRGEPAGDPVEPDSDKAPEAESNER